MNAEDIISDRASGSTLICERTCAILSSLPREEGLDAAKRILDAHRPMALLHSCIRRYLSGEDVSAFMEGYRERMERAAQHARSHLEGKRSVMTMSSSSAVEKALSAFKGRIFVMESRPMLEGSAMARKLHEKGLDVTVVSDAYGISMVARGEIDAVLVGADAIYRNMLINKVGTYALRTAALHSGTNFMAVLTTDKVFPEDVELSDEDIMQFHDPKEISDLSALNPYFEAIPIENTVVITEKGENGL